MASALRKKQRDASPLQPCCALLLRAASPSKTCLWVLLSCVLLSNAALFFMGASLLDGAALGLGLYGQGSHGGSFYMNMWKAPLSLPPRDYRCDEWLGEEDSLNGTRNFAKDWVKVHSMESGVFPCSDVACHFLQNTKGTHNFARSFCFNFFRFWRKSFGNLAQTWSVTLTSSGMTTPAPCR